MASFLDQLKALGSKTILPPGMGGTSVRPAPYQQPSSVYGPAQPPQMSVANTAPKPKAPTPPKPVVSPVKPQMAALPKTGAPTPAPAAQLATQQQQTAPSPAPSPAPSGQMNQSLASNPEIQRMFGIYGGQQAFERDAKPGAATAIQRDFSAYTDAKSRADMFAKGPQDPGGSNAAAAANFKAQADKAAQQILNNPMYQYFFPDQVASLARESGQQAPNVAAQTAALPGATPATGTAGTPPAAPTGVPQGATLISGPSGLQGLSESQIYRDPNSKNIYKLPAAAGASAGAAPAAPTPAPSPQTGAVNAGSPYATSQTELDVQKQLDALAAKEAAVGGSEALGLANIEDQAIPMQFITGQQAGLQRQAAAQLQALSAQEVPLKTRLAQEQAKRQAALDLSEKQKPFEAGGFVYQFNPATGKYDKGEQSKKDYASGSVGEYQFYVDQEKAAGRTPKSFTEYQNEDANRKARVAAAGQNPDRILSATEAQSLGVPFGTTASQAYGLSPTKPLTESQAKDVTFGNRASEANQYIDNLGSKIVKMNPVSFAAQVAAEPNAIGNAFVSDDIRQLRQAERNFETAVLRRESGAAISASEFATDEKKYFPRPGDDEQTLKQKAQARQTAIQTMMQAGKQGTPETYVAPDGTNYVKGSDGLYYPKASGGLSAADPKKIAAAIKKVESGGNYSAKGASGEFGAYQFMPATWRGWAKQYLGNANAPMTPQNQDKVAESHINELLAQGKTPEEIALIWNGGQPIRKKGVNSMGVAYDSGAYADKVLRELNA